MNKGNTLIRPKRLINLREGRLVHITNIKTISGCRNLVPTSPNTASGETLVHALRIDTERANNGVCRGSTIAKRSGCGV